MTADHEAMRRALQERLVPALRERGFSGSLPHFRRSRDGVLAFLSVQFSKWGGEFIIELARTSAAAPYRTQDGRTLAPDEMKATALDLSDRARLHAGASAAIEQWFGYRPFAFRRWRNAGRFTRAADAVVARLAAADAWWSGAAAEPAVRQYR